MTKNAVGQVDRWVGENIRRLRQEREMTLADVATAVTDRLGRSVGFNAVSRIETGQRTVSVDEVVAFAKVLDVDTDSLLASPELAEIDGFVALAKEWVVAGRLVAQLTEQKEVAEIQRRQLGDQLREMAKGASPWVRSSAREIPDLAALIEEEG
jgi:transcriptional regulator with XRE-family HTH domain